MVDNVLSSLELKLVRDEIDSMLTNQAFHSNANNDTDIRDDSVIWVAEPIGCIQKLVIGPHLLLALRRIRSIPQEMSQNGFDEKVLGVPFENQLACYDGNLSKYIPHRDCPETTLGWKHPLQWLFRPGLEDREYTIILYLNDEVWDSTVGGLGDSGNLKCYMNADMSDVTGGSATEMVLIEPVGGRLVIFDSKKILHEVRPSVLRRVALTCWVGGSHSSYTWFRPACIPVSEIDWLYLLSE